MTQQYSESFQNLRTDGNKNRYSFLTNYRAPYKPLLLLTVFDLIQQGLIKTNLIEITPELCDTFDVYWSRVMSPEIKSNIAMPFFFMKSEGFWHLVPRPGMENQLQMLLNAGTYLNTVSQLNNVTLGARLDDELFALLQEEKWRDVFRSILTDKYFASPLRESLLEQSVINDEAYKYSLDLLKEEHSITIKPNEIKTAVRSQGFRIAVVKTYAHRCTTCGIRILTADGHTIVEAAHIVPFSVTQNDDPRNGLCLCRSCHWSFDEGLISVSSKYEVMTSAQLSTNNNLPSYIATLEGRGIIHPIEEKFLPDKNALAWHRKEVFRKIA